MKKDLGADPYLQKLVKIIPYWIKHNNEHVNEHKNWMDDAKKLGLTGIARELAEVIDLLQKANQHIDNINEKVNRWFKRKIPTGYDNKGVKKFIKEDTIDMLNSYVKLLEENKELHTPVDIEAITKPFIAQNELKFPQLFQPIRISLTGGTQAPSVYDMVAILGIEETIRRINSAIEANFGREE